MNEFDENVAARFINDRLNAKYSVTYPDDELINIIDMIFDWYDDNGMLEIDFEDEDDDDSFAEIVAHVKKVLAKDADSPVLPEHVEDIVKAEIEYENTLDPLL